MKILGLDLSLTGTGVVVLEDGKVVVEELIKSKPHEEKTPVHEIERIVLIKERILTIAEESNPDLVCIEGLAFGVRNATALVQLAGLNYMIREYLWQRGIKFLIVAPTSLKKFTTGHGNAKKEEMMLEVFNKYGIAFTDDNCNDAFCLANLGRSLLLDHSANDREREVLNTLKKQL